MSVLRQVEELLPALSRAEKAHLPRLVAQDLDDSFPGIDSTQEFVVANRASFEPVSRSGRWSNRAGWG